jgi:hypothetical protein
MIPEARAKAEQPITFAGTNVHDISAKHCIVIPDRTPSTSSIANVIVDQLDSRHTNAATPKTTSYRNELRENTFS